MSAHWRLGKPPEVARLLPASAHLLCPGGAAAAGPHPDELVWVVVGDVARVRPQLEGLGLPVEIVQPN